MNVVYSRLLGPSRCFPFWQEVLACYVTNTTADDDSGKAKCAPVLEDYYECLHHKKEVSHYKPSHCNWSLRSSLLYTIGCQSSSHTERLQEGAEGASPRGRAVSWRYTEPWSREGHAGRQDAQNWDFPDCKTIDGFRFIVSVNGLSMCIYMIKQRDMTT